MQIEYEVIYKTPTTEIRVPRTVYSLREVWKSAYGYQREGKSIGKAGMTLEQRELIVKALGKTLVVDGLELRHSAWAYHQCEGNYWPEVLKNYLKGVYEN